MRCGSLTSSRCRTTDNSEVNVFRMGARPIRIWKTTCQEADSPVTSAVPLRAAKTFTQRRLLAGWYGGTCSPILSRGVLAVVNRQRTKPNDCGSKPFWQQPLYILLKRDGTYLCGRCNRENQSFVVHTYLRVIHKRVQIRDRDAEVIGKIVLALRRLA
jgi:hypothetical protein